MRLLIVSDAWEPQINGVVRTYQNIVRETQAAGHTVEVIGPDRFLSVPMPGYAEIRLSMFARARLYKLMRDFKADAVHIAVEGPLGWAARGWCLKHNMPFSTSFHTQFPDYVAARMKFGAKYVRNIAIRMMRRFHAPAKTTFVATPSLEEQLRAWGFTQPMTRLLRGVDFDVFHAGDATLFGDLPRPVHLYVGRVAVEKNLAAFLDLKLPGSKVIVGSGPSLDIFRRTYKDVVFAGVQQGKALADHYRSADVFVFPSKTDTFGIVLIEAMACGLPIAGYDAIGPRDIVTAPILGAVDEDLGRAVEKALAAPGSRLERQAHAQDLYSWRAVAETFVKSSENSRS